MPVFLRPGQKGFPPVSFASPEGLIAVGGSLDLEQLLVAYANGIFPWYDEGAPILWWNPPERCILRPRELHVPRSLRRVLNARRFRVTLDRAFPDVIRGCASVYRQDQDGTWIMPEMIEAYTALHQAGFAHSAEAWLGDTLVGGLYGVSLGGVFFGESMFTVVPDASKVCLVWLVRLLGHWGFGLVDCQQVTDNLLRFGALAVTREAFMDELRQNLGRAGQTGRWCFPSDFFPL